MTTLSDSLRNSYRVIPAVLSHQHSKMFLSWQPPWESQLDNVMLLLPDFKVNFVISWFIVIDVCGGAVVEEAACGGCPSLRSVNFNF